MSVVINTLQKLAIEHQWLVKDEKKAKRLEALLDEAMTHAGKGAVQLIAKLIRRCEYISQDEYEEYIMLIAKFLHENFDLSRAILCATTADTSKDSAQRVLYDVTTGLAGLGVYKPNTLNRYDQACKAFNKNPCLKEIILIDEFVGTGQSISGRAKALTRIFTQAKKKTPPIHFIGLAGMHFGLRRIEPYLSSVNVCLALRRGIRDFSSEKSHADEYDLMDRLESNLSASYGGVNLPNYGYGRSEALYSRNGGSCPNNVFPIFWWPKLANSTSRSPLFPRSM